MSALPPKADIGTQSRNVRFVPKDRAAAQNVVIRLIIGAADHREHEGCVAHLI